MSFSILITGASGFIGSHILEALMQVDHADLHIIAACRNRKKLLPTYKGEVRSGDLRDPVYLDHVLAGVDIIFHAAAWTSMWGNKKNSRKLYLEPTLQLIDKALEWKVKRFINPGSVFAAANTDANPHEPGKQRRYWPHLNHMIEIENYMRDNSYMSCSMVNLRLGIPAGERHDLGMLPLLIWALKNKKLSWYSNRQQLPVVNAKDIAQAFVRAALAPQQLPYESFNVVGPDAPSSKQLLDFISQEYQHTRPWLNIPRPLAYVSSWISEQLQPLSSSDAMITRSVLLMLQGSEANNERARELIGYQPEIHWQHSIRQQMETLTQPTGRKICLQRPVKELDIE